MRRSIARRPTPAADSCRRVTTPCWGSASATRISSTDRGARSPPWGWQGCVAMTMPTSVLERRFLALLAAHDLPRPEINRRSDEGELDATWHEQRLIVECDGFATHGTREAFERDRAKDRALQVAGWRVVRLTWRQLADDPETVAAHLRALLGVK